MSPASPSRGCYHSQGVDRSSQFSISHLPLTTSHERKYFVGILSSPSLCARLPFFFQFLLITQVPVWPHWPLLRKSHANLAGNMEVCGVCILSFWSQGLFETSPFLSCVRKHARLCVCAHACVRVCARVRACVRARVRVCTRVRVCACACICLCVTRKIGGRVRDALHYI